MSSTAVSHDFLLKSAKGQLGFKPTAHVSLNDVDSLPRPSSPSAVFIRTTRVDEILCFFSSL